MTDTPTGSNSNIDEHITYLTENTPFDEVEATVFAHYQFRNGYDDLSLNSGQIEDVWDSINNTFREATALLEHVPNINPRWDQQPLQELGRHYFGTGITGEGDEMEYWVIHRTQMPEDEQLPYEQEYYVTYKAGDWNGPQHKLFTWRRSYNNRETLVEDVLLERDAKNEYTEANRYAFLVNTGFEDVLPPAEEIASSWQKWSLHVLVEEGVLRTKKAAELADTTPNDFFADLQKHGTGENTPNHLSYDAS